MATTPHDLLQQVRGATYRGDGEGVVALLGTSAWSDLLQHAGDGLVIALTENVDGSSEPAQACASALRERGWVGDDELADQLDARLGDGPAPMLRPLPVDLDQLAGALEGDPREPGGRIDLRSGEVWPGETFDPWFVETDPDDPDDPDDPERWLHVDRLGSRDGYRDMVRFVDHVADPDVADRLRIALDGRGAFRRFRDVLDRWPEHIAAWRTLSDERRRGRARAWLAGEGYAPVPR